MELNSVASLDSFAGDLRSGPLLAASPTAASSGDTYVSRWGTGTMTFFTAWSRFVFTVALGILCCACIIDPNGMVAAALSIPLFETLAQLTYGVYLVHIMLIVSLLYRSVSLARYGSWIVASTFLSVWVASHAVAWFAFVLVEEPFARLQRIGFKHVASLLKPAKNNSNDAGRAKQATLSIESEMGTTSRTGLLSDYDRIEAQSH